MIKSFCIGIAVSLLLWTEAQAKTVVIGLDLSGSSPLYDPVFPAKAAKRVHAIIKNMEMGDTVVLRSLGEYRTLKNPLSADFKIAYRTNPDVVARTVGKFITGFSTKAHTIQKEAETNVIGFIDNTAASHSCAQDDVTIIVIGDALEYSALANSYELIKSNSGSLPPLPLANLSGCQLEFWGFGYGFDAASVQNLKRIWMNWTSSAGFKSVLFLNDW